MKNINIKKILNSPSAKTILTVILLLLIVISVWLRTGDKIKRKQRAVLRIVF